MKSTSVGVTLPLMASGSPDVRTRAASTVGAEGDRAAAQGYTIRCCDYRRRLLSLLRPTKRSNDCSRTFKCSYFHRLPSSSAAGA
jgi:hypothetical protein